MGNGCCRRRNMTVLAGRPAAGVVRWRRRYRSTNPRTQQAGVAMLTCCNVREGLILVGCWFRGLAFLWLLLILSPLISVLHGTHPGGTKPEICGVVHGDAWHRRLLSPVVSLSLAGMPARQTVCIIGTRSYLVSAHIRVLHALCSA